MWRAINAINFLEHEDKIVASKAGDIQQVIVDYFSTLFTSIGPSNYADMSACVDTNVSDD